MIARGPQQEQPRARIERAISARPQRREGETLRASLPQWPVATGLARTVLLAVCVVIFAGIPAGAAALRIVAIGASNTHGWYVGNEGAFPAQLEGLLRKRGNDVQVTNAGVPFDTTWMMLRRLDRDVPDGTDIVIVQLGSNDLRFLGTMQQRAANVAEMERRLQARSIKTIVYDEKVEKVPLRYYTLDFIHWTREGHAMIAAALLPRVLSMIEHRQNDEPPSRAAHAR